MILKLKKREPDVYPENLVSPVVLRRLGGIFGVDGGVGTPGQKDKPSCVGLSYQVQGEGDGGSGEEVGSAVIGAVAPGSSLRNYSRKSLGSG